MIICKSRFRKRRSERLPTGAFDTVLPSVRSVSGPCEPFSSTIIAGTTAITAWFACFCILCYEICCTSSIVQLFTALTIRLQSNCCVRVILYIILCVIDCRVHQVGSACFDHLLALLKMFLICILIALDTELFLLLFKYRHVVAPATARWRHWKKLLHVVCSCRCVWVCFRLHAWWYRDTDCNCVIIVDLFVTVVLFFIVYLHLFVSGICCLVYGAAITRMHVGRLVWMGLRGGGRRTFDGRSDRFAIAGLHRWTPGWIPGDNHSTSE